MISEIIDIQYASIYLVPLHINLYLNIIYILLISINIYRIIVYKLYISHTILIEDTSYSGNIVLVTAEATEQAKRRRISRENK